MAEAIEKVLGVFDIDALRQRFEHAGVFRVVADRGFSDPQIEVITVGQAIPHVHLYGNKNRQRHLLLEACLSETVVRPAFFAARGFPIESPIYLAVAYWVREQDPTRPFRHDRPRLPLQRHPGLGCLRQAFRVITGMAIDLGKDGVACMPKFFHDAYIFHRSRLFLFLDPAEQGRFEALVRDLRPLSLRDTSLALVSAAVSDRDGVPVSWRPGYQVFPLSPRLTAYFNSPKYEQAVVEQLNLCHFDYDQRLLSPLHGHIDAEDITGLIAGT
jgi:hypothetical protein